MVGSITADLFASFADPVEDVAEETFVLFSQELPANDLGMIDGKTDEVEFEVNGRSISVTQSSSLLVSRRTAGTTGAVVWKVTPRIAQWLASDACVLRAKGILDFSKNVVELGCGISGLIGVTLSPFVRSYVLTDQNYIMKHLKENVARNLESNTTTRKSSKRDSKGSQGLPQKLYMLAMDWEHDSVQNLRTILPHPSTIDFVIICDCVFNDFLIEPLTQTCVDISKLDSTGNTIFMVAQQLRADDVFEHWLTRFVRDFVVYRLRDEFLPADLKSTSGYVVHLALSQSCLSL